MSESEGIVLKIHPKTAGHIEDLRQKMNAPDAVCTVRVALAILSTFFDETVAENTLIQVSDLRDLGKSLSAAITASMS